MNFRRAVSLFFEAGLALSFACTALAQVNVTTWHNDLTRSGANTQETILTPANVSASGSFGQLFSVALDGAVYTQPLYLAGLTIAGGTHNVVFVATEHDSVYALDADTGTILWQRSFLGPGMSTVTPIPNCPDIPTEYGITGTPVIDPTTGTLYVVSVTNPGPIQQLHSIDVLTGQDKLGGTVTIAATVPGTGIGGNGTSVSFNPLMENQRAALTLTNGHVIVAWGSHCDYSPYHGWIMSYNAATLAQEAVFNTTANGKDGGIWMSGGGPSVDANGFLYFGSSNGDFGYPSNADVADTIMKMPQPVAGQSWLPVDGFAPWNQSTLSSNNEDVGAGAEVLLPDLPSGATHQQLMISAGKLGEIFVLDRNHLGLYCTTCSTSQTDTNIVQEIDGQIYSDMLSSAAYWNGRIFFGQSRSVLKEFSFNTTTGAVSPTAVQAGTYVFNPTSPTPEISSNGTSDGIVWVLDTGNTAGEVLLAYDATNLSNVLAQLPVGYPGTHFSVPTVVNGKVYAGSQGGLTAFGLLNTKPTLTITASNVSVPYNQPIPPLTGYTATGFVNGDNSSVLSGAPVETTTAVQGSPAGAYPITITQGTLAAANYNFAFVNGTLTISGSQSQTISFSPIPNVTYGSGPIALSATASSGLPVTYSVVGPAKLNGSTLTIVGTGAVSVTASQPGNANYAAATPVTETFTVNPAPLTVTAANVSVAYNQPIPTLTGYTAAGFVNGDTSSVLSGSPAESTTAVQGSPVGTYPISIAQGTLAAANYSFTFVNGSLSILNSTVQVSLAISPNPVPPQTAVTYSVTVAANAGQPNPVGTITIYAMSNGQAVPAGGPYPIGSAGSAGTSTLSSSVSATVPPGTYTVFATYQPAAGSPYQSASSPQMSLVFQ